MDRSIAELKLNTERELELAKNEAEVLKVQAAAESANSNSSAIIQQLEHELELSNQNAEQLSAEVTHLKQQLSLS